MKAECHGGRLYWRLDKRFKTGLNYGGGSGGAENLRYISEAGATRLTDVSGRQRKEGDQRRFQGFGLSTCGESDII